MVSANEKSVGKIRGLHDVERMVTNAATSAAGMGASMAMAEAPYIERPGGVPSSGRTERGREGGQSRERDQRAGERGCGFRGHSKLQLARPLSLLDITVLVCCSDDELG